MSDIPPVRSGRPFFIGLFLLTAAVLALEVLDTRLLSVITWYTLAFLVITLGVFGLSVGAVRVYLNPHRYGPENLHRRLAEDALQFAWLVPASYALLLILPLQVASNLTTIVLFVAFSAAIALPFVPAGAAIAAALTRTGLPVGRVYAVDLAGAAAGSLLVPLLLRASNGGAAILLTGLLGAAASWAFLSGTGPQDRRLRGRTVATAAALAALILLTAATDRGLVPLWCKGKAEDRGDVVREAWNSHSRIQVRRPLRERAAIWGPGRACGRPMVRQSKMTIDGEAQTVLFDAAGNLDTLRFLLCDVTNVAHYLRPDGPMAVIGVGGSKDIQSALLFDHAPVVGIEINPLLLDVLRGPEGQATAVLADRRVRLVHDEGRSWLLRTPERFQIIQASLIDTWAATGAGAHALSENGLYTVEAWTTFLDRLQPGGIFTVSRWYSAAFEDETARMASLGMAALLERGAGAPRDHVALVASRELATLLVAREPLLPADVQRLDQVSQRLGFDILAAPGRGARVPLVERILACPDRACLETTSLTPTLDFRPPTDERPFFFNMVRLRSFARSDTTTVGAAPTPQVILGNRLATRALVLAFLASLVLAGAALVVPMAIRAPLRERLGPGLIGALAWFTCIGLGFMLVEIGLLQRLSLVLGLPSLSLLVVLPGLVGGTGLGALVSDRMPLSRAPWCYAVPLAIATLVAAAAWMLPALALRVQAEPLATRIGASLAVTLAFGAFLGLAFPAGMRLVRPRFDAETPWFWGMNGVGSILGGCGAVALALELGLSKLFLVAAAVYLLLIPACALIRRER